MYNRSVETTEQLNKIIKNQMFIIDMMNDMEEKMDIITQNALKGASNGSKCKCNDKAKANKK